MPRLLASLFVLLLAVSFVSPAAAQEAGGEGSVYRYGTGLGGEVFISNYGFGLGLHGRRRISGPLSLSMMLQISQGKHPGEQALFDYFGRRVVPGKAHYLLMMPVHFGIERRVFREHIADNFRPFWQLSAGPTLGYEYPYFDDENGNFYRDGEEETYDAIGGLLKGSFKPGVGGMIALGAHFGEGRVSQGVRVGFAVNYFPGGVEMLQPAVRGGERQYEHGFYTPTISLLFGRVY